MNKKYTKEMLEEVSSKCFSFRQMILKFGLKETGGNYKNIQDRCKKFNIDTSHFFGMGWNKLGHPDFQKYDTPLNEYFVKSDKKNHHLMLKID